MSTEFVYVERRDGVIVGVYQNRQMGYAEERVSETDPTVVAFKAAREESIKPLPPTTERVVLKELIIQAVLDNVAFAALTNPAVSLLILTDQVRRLTRQNTVILQRLVQLSEGKP